MSKKYLCIKATTDFYKSSKIKQLYFLRYNDIEQMVQIWIPVVVFQYQHSTGKSLFCCFGDQCVSCEVLVSCWGNVITTVSASLLSSWLMLLWVSVCKNSNVAHISNITWTNCWEELPCTCLTFQLFSFFGFLLNKCNLVTTNVHEELLSFETSYSIRTQWDELLCVRHITSPCLVFG